MIANYNGEVKNKREQRSTNRNKEITRNRFNNFPQRQTSLQNINIFHTDRGNEFKNKLIDETLEAFNEELKIELADYVNWFNNHRIHSSLDYLTPREFKENTLKKVV